MALNRLIPMLESNDLKASLAYYRDILGFELTGIAPDADNPYWIAVKRDGIELMFSSRNAHSLQPKPEMTGVLYIYSDNVEEIWEELKEKVEIAWPLQSFDYGMKEFGIRDCHGYLLSFGQEIKE